MTVTVGLNLCPFPDRCRPILSMTVIRIRQPDSAACQGMTGEPTDGALSLNGGWSVDSDARQRHSHISTGLGYTRPGHSCDTKVHPHHLGSSVPFTGPQQADAHLAGSGVRAVVMPSRTTGPDGGFRTRPATGAVAPPPAAGCPSRANGKAPARARRRIRMARPSPIPISSPWRPPKLFAPGAIR